jgi:hypothetical protein
MINWAPQFKGMEDHNYIAFCTIKELAFSIIPKFLPHLSIAWSHLKTRLYK